VGVVDSVDFTMLQRDHLDGLFVNLLKIPAAFLCDQVGFALPFVLG
jgi:hypothetical protein